MIILSEYNIKETLEEVTGYIGGKVKEGLDSKEDIFRFPTMPTASADNAGEIIQYTGATNTNYIHGCFYECVENNNTYSWQQVIGQSQEFIGTTAEWNALTTEQKALYEIVNITDDVQSGQATLNGVVLAGDKTSHQVGVANETNQGTVESYSTAQNAHDEGTYFVNSLGQFVKATEDIAIGDTIDSSNTETTTIATVLSEVNNNHIVSGTSKADLSDIIANLTTEQRLFSTVVVNDKVCICRVASGTGTRFDSIAELASDILRNFQYYPFLGDDNKGRFIKVEKSHSASSVTTTDVTITSWIIKY